jgi:hypothetical protein
MSPKKSAKAQKSQPTKKEKSSLKLMSDEELKILRQKERDYIRKWAQERFSEEEILRIHQEALSSTKSNTESNILIRTSYLSRPKEDQ